MAPDSVKMLKRRFGLFPASFWWRGQVYNIDAVNECQTVTNRIDQSTAYHFWVRCDGQRFHLCEVLPPGRWLLWPE